MTARTSRQTSVQEFHGKMPGGIPARPLWPLIMGLGRWRTLRTSPCCAAAWYVAGLTKAPHANHAQNFRSSFRLGQVPVLRLRLMRREVADAYEANRHALHDTERRIGHKFARLTQLADAFGLEELMLASMDGRFLGEEHSEQ